MFALEAWKRIVALVDAPGARVVAPKFDIRKKPLGKLPADRGDSTRFFPPRL
jgi:hypothetical protein